jgi:hypothetical protein
LNVPITNFTDAVVFMELKMIYRFRHCPLAYVINTQWTRICYHYTYIGPHVNKVFTHGLGPLNEYAWGFSTPSPLYPKNGSCVLAKCIGMHFSPNSQSPSPLKNKNETDVHHQCLFLKI